MSELPCGQSPSELMHVGGAWSWARLRDDKILAWFEAAIAARISARRWFGSKSRAVAAVRLLDDFALDAKTCLALVEVQFATGPSEIYQLPLATATADEFARFSDDAKRHEWTRLTRSDPEGELVLYDAAAACDGRDALLTMFQERTLASSSGAKLIAVPGPASDLLEPRTQRELEAHLSQAEQSNTSVRYGKQLILKIYRRIEQGINPDWEINLHLARQKYPYIPPLVGALEYRSPTEPAWSLALLQGFVSNQGDGWSYMLEQLERLFDEALRSPDARHSVAGCEDGLCAASENPLPPDAERLFGVSLETARQLGERTAGMHLALAQAANESAFEPRPLSTEDRANEFRQASRLLRETLEILERQRTQFGDDIALEAEELLRASDRLELMQRAAAEIPISVSAIRIHGDFHLGQTLIAQQGPVMIDFEGEPSRPLDQRREKRLALRDVAGMIRSFHYASCAAAIRYGKSHGPQAVTIVTRLSQAWYDWVSASYLRAYRRAAHTSAFLPHDACELRALLDACILDKAVYELRYELNNRPDWVYLPLRALLQLVKGRG